MRIAKMPHVHWDDEKKRYVVRRRVPVDAQAIIGRKVVTHKFKQGVDERTANDLSVDIVRGWEAEWDAARAGIDPHLIAAPPTGRSIVIAKGVYTVRQPGQPLELSGSPARLIKGRRGEDILVEELPVERTSEPEKLPPAHVALAALVAEWKRGREGKTLPKAEQAMVSKVNRLRACLKHDDATIVTTDNLMAYRRHLLDLKEAGELEPKTVEDHILMLRKLFKAGAQGKLILSNPADFEGFTYKGRTDDRNKRKTFALEERRRILELARHAEPVVRWSNWIAHFSGACNTEIIEADTRDVVAVSEEDGKPVFHIRLDHRPDTMRVKTDVRPRPTPLHSAVIAEGFLDYVDWVRREHHGGGDGPLFPMIPLDSDGRRNDNGTNRINGWLHGVVETEKTFYSHRHTFKTMARWPVMDEETHDAITGHGSSKISREYGYYPMDKMRIGIEKIRNPLSARSAHDAALVDADPAYTEAAE
jgi:hypothetical protein